MSNELRLAVWRIFGTAEAACRASGLKLEDIHQWAKYSGRQIRNLVTAVRMLENLKGRTRRTKLREIYHKNDDNRRIIQFHFESLERLAAQEGIDPQVVALETYRDEADVKHDLDKLEQAGKPLCYDTLRRGHKRLYNVIKETGRGLNGWKRIGSGANTYLKTTVYDDASAILVSSVFLLRSNLYPWLKTIAVSIYQPGKEKTLMNWIAIISIHIQ